MKLCGLSQQAIADKLNEDGILSPMEYKKSIGINLKSTFKKGTQARWTYKAVDRILKNEIYTGVLIQGKQTHRRELKKKLHKNQIKQRKMKNLKPYDCKKISYKMAILRPIKKVS